MRVPGCSPVRRGHSASPGGPAARSPGAFLTPNGSADDLSALALNDDCAGLALLPPPAHPFWRSADVAEQARHFMPLGYAFALLALLTFARWA